MTSEKLQRVTHWWDIWRDRAYHRQHKHLHGEEGFAHGFPKYIGFPGEILLQGVEDVVAKVPEQVHKCIYITEGHRVYYDKNKPVHEVADDSKANKVEDEVQHPPPLDGHMVWVGLSSWGIGSNMTLGCLSRNTEKPSLASLINWRNLSSSTPKNQSVRATHTSLTIC